MKTLRHKTTKNEKAPKFGLYLHKKVYLCALLQMISRVCKVRN